jgi:curved DNA-binding protein CbpA
VTVHSHALLQEFSRINEAFNTLRDPQLRASYDAKRAGVAASELRCAVEVDLDDMAFEEESGVYTTSCRCGDAYTITTPELEAGIDVVQCPSCSLRARILYAVADSGDESEGEEHGVGEGGVHGEGEGT